MFKLKFVVFAFLVSLTRSAILNIEQGNFCAIKKCHKNAYCINRENQAQCVCKYGFYGTGEHCNGNLKFIFFAKFKI
jgi:hypothetical protein